MRLILFTTSTCHNCPPMKEYFETIEKVDKQIYEADTSEEGMRLAKNFLIYAVPTVLVLDENDKVVFKTSSKEELKEYIENA